ncbi:hypothetical protein C9374_008151 [Naegleria lovaniensis]|uniref:Ammonium transporter AmtB-like domain-containing protein n=1 Tax=Naegleria lovaniensis TaxID=51637 RepID=A0AA88GJI4_NAELO|nr:uncharacterized protein C9374_008151 [Naegleria lovaniensis]KAG2378512.1 hypothetical protein C9374_008151 [Naegleria lovaniensis]
MQSEDRMNSVPSISLSAQKEEEKPSNTAAEVSESGHTHGWNAENISFLVLVGAFQVVMVVLFWVFFDYEHSVTNSDEASLHTANEEAQHDVAHYYKPMLDVGIMVFVGFGFLMTFLKRYGYMAFGMNFFISALIFQWGILNQAFWRGVNKGFPVTGDQVHWPNPRWMVHFELQDLVEGHFAAASFLVSFGVLIGKTTPLQITVAGIIHTLFYALNYYIGTWVLKASDIGGSMFIHLFGAVYGLMASYVLWNKKAIAGHPAQSSRYTSDLFSLIGTIFLFLCWPSFNAAVTPTGTTQFRAFINTIMSLMGSAVASFFCSRLVRGGVFAMEDIQNGTLAGGVAVGAVADMVILPGGALTVGIIAGFISVFGFKFFTPNLRRFLKLHDTCGVLNLHCIPGFIGGVGSIIAAGVAAGQRVNYGVSYDKMFGNGTHQWGYQFATLAITIGIAIVSGLLAGLIIRWLFPEKSVFYDEPYWEVADESMLVDEPPKEEKKNTDIELKAVNV